MVGSYQRFRDIELAFAVTIQGCPAVPNEDEVIVRWCWKLIKSCKEFEHVAWSVGGFVFCSEVVNFVFVG